MAPLDLDVPQAWACADVDRRIRCEYLQSAEEGSVINDRRGIRSVRTIDAPLGAKLRFERFDTKAASLRSLLDRHVTESSHRY